MVAGTCLCLHAQRAARALARRFDAAFRPFGLTNGQFSLLMALNRPQPPSMGQLAPFLAMDRTTLTAALKPLERKGYVQTRSDPRDARSRRAAITEQGVGLLNRALPVWQATHAEIEAALAPDGSTSTGAQGLRDGLNRIAGVTTIAPACPPLSPLGPV